MAVTSPAHGVPRAASTALASFRRWHNETYGVTAAGSVAEHLDPATSIHNKMWALKEPLAHPGENGLDAYGRKWQMKTWKLDGHEVGCRMS